MNAAAPYCEDYLLAMGVLNHLPSKFTHKLGRPWMPQARPADIELATPKQCYQNAAALVMQHRNLWYVEGYACPPGLIPLHHAWCVDSDGRVIDPTLQEPQNTQYFGIPVSAGFLFREIEKSGYWGLFAESVPPARFFGCLADVQAGVWAVPSGVEAEVRILLAPIERFNS